MNPFQDPDKINKEVNKDVRKIITFIFKEKGSLNFHDMLEYFENSIKNKDLDRSKISAYYCANVILSQPTLTDVDRFDLITGINKEIEKLEDEEQNIT